MTWLVTQYIPVTQEYLHTFLYRNGKTQGVPIGAPLFSMRCVGLSTSTVTHCAVTTPFNGKYEKKEKGEMC
jgi:hypothetical protein